MMLRIVRRAFLVILIIAIFFVLLIALIWYNPGASQFSVRQALKFSPVDIEIASIDGSFNQGLSIQDIHVSVPNTVVDISTLSWQWVGFDWSKKIVMLDQLKIDQPSITITSNSDTDKEASEFAGFSLPVGVVVKEIHIDNANLVLNERTEVFERIHFGIDAVGDKVAVKTIDFQRQALTVKGDAEAILNASLPFSFTHQIQWAQSPTNAIVTGVISGDLSNIQIEDSIEFTQQDQINTTVNVKGNIDLQTDAPLLDVLINTPVVNIQATPEKDITVSDADIHLSGAIDEYLIMANWGVSGDDIPDATMKMEAQGNLTEIRISSLLTETLQGSLTTTADITLAETIDVITSTTLKNINPGVQWQQWPGDVNGDINVEVTLAPEQPAQVSISKLALEGKLRKFPLALNVVANITPQIMQLDNADLRIANNKITASGVYQQDKVNADVDANIIDFSQILPGASGELSLKGTVNGNPQQPVIDATLNGNKLRYNEFSMASVDAMINSNKNAVWDIQAQVMDIQSEQPIAQQVTINANGKIDQHRVVVSADLSALQAQLEIAGGWSNDAWSGQLLSNELQLKEPQQTWQLAEAVNVDYSAERSELSRACWQLLGNPGNVCTEVVVNTADDMSVDAGVVINEFDINAIEAWMPEGLLLSGVVQGEGALEYTPDSWVLNAEVGLDKGAIDYNPVDGERYKADIEVATLRSSSINNSTTMAASLGLSDGSTASIDLLAEGAPNTDMRISGDLQAAIKNTDYLAALSPEIEALTGTLNAKASISGTTAAPVVNAEAALQSISLARSQTTLENILFTLDQSTLDSYNINLAANSGEGAIETAGVLSVPDAQSWELNAVVTGSDFEALRLAEIELDVSPDLKIEANNKLINITGDISVPYGLVDIKQLPPKAVQSSPDIVVHTEQAAEVTNKSPIDIAFTINTRIEDSIQFNALGFESKLSGGLRVRKPATDNIVRANGRLQINQGKYELYGQKLAINNGELLFNGPINNPGIDVKATRTSQDGEVVAGIRFGGTINNLQSELYSEPSLPEGDVLAYLLTGKALGSSSEFGGEQLLQAAVLLGLKKNGSLLTQLQTSLGVDVLTINEGNNTGESAIEAGKFLSDDFYIGYSYGLFNRVGFWLVNYQLTQALRLESRYGEQQSIDLMYSIERD